MCRAQGVMQGARAFGGQAPEMLGVLKLVLSLSIDSDA